MTKNAAQRSSWTFYEAINMMRFKPWTGYVLYGVAVTIVFLYLLFPGEALMSYISARVERDYPQWNIEMASARMVLPVGVKMTNCAVSLKSKPAAVLKADSMTVRPSLWGLITGNPSVSLKAKMYDGTVKAGVATVTSKAGKTADLDVNVDKVNMGKCSFTEAIFGRRIEGTLAGSLTYKGTVGKSVDGDGTVTFTLRAGTIPLSRDVLGFEKVSFDVVDSDLVLKRKTLQVKKLNISGKEMNGDFTGRMTLQDNIMKSALSLRGTMDFPAMRKKITMTLGGTLADPIPRFK